MSFELPKIFAALCIALIAAWLTSFIATQAVQSKSLDKNAVEIEVAEAPEAEAETAPAAQEIVAASTASAAPAKKAGAEPILALLAAADIAKGKKISKACAACHSFDKGGAKKVGPNLYGIIGKKQASVDGFKYSKAFQNLDGVWDYKELNSYLWKPKKHVPGTAMSYAGVKKTKDRAALIAWLRTLADTPAALPTAADIAAEAK